MEVKNNQDLLTNIFLEQNLAVLFIVNRCELKRIELKTSVDRLGLSKSDLPNLEVFPGFRSKKACF